MEELLKKLKTLTSLDAISSNEKEVSKYLKNQNDSAYTDGLGSVIYEKGHGKKVLVASHIDEIGFIVTKVTKDGFIKIQPVGQFYSQNTLNQLFTITTKMKKIKAVSTYKPLQVIANDYKNKQIEVKDMVLDAGFKTDLEAYESGVMIGDMVTLYSEFNILNDEIIVTKALNNRTGVLSLLEVFNNIGDLNINLGLAFSVQNSMGNKGAKTTSFLFNPDLSISLDACVANDIVNPDSSAVKMGSGPVIMFYDSGMIAHQGFRNYVLTVANNFNIKYQESFIENQPTEASYMHLSGIGAPSLAIGIPVRNLDSNTSMVNINDIKSSIMLLTKVLESLDEEVINSIINE